MKGGYSFRRFKWNRELIPEKACLPILRLVLGTNNCLETEEHVAFCIERVSVFFLPADELQHLPDRWLNYNIYLTGG